MPITASSTLKKTHEIAKMKTKQVSVPTICATNWLAPP
jgi:hypothetical protein